MGELSTFVPVVLLRVVISEETASKNRPNLICDDEGLPGTICIEHELQSVTQAQL